jgi:hypothetical protein
MSTCDMCGVSIFCYGGPLRISTLYGMHPSQECNHVTWCENDKNEMEHKETT